MQCIKDIIESDHKYVSEKSKLQGYLDNLEKTLKSRRQTEEIHERVEYPFDDRNEIHR